MKKTRLRHFLWAALAVGICVGMVTPALSIYFPVRPILAPSLEAISEALPSVRPKVAPELPPEPPAPEPIPEPAAVEEAPTREEELQRVAGLLAGWELTQEQTDALCTRLVEDSALLALLEEGELTRADLVYLALPNGWASRLNRYRAWAAKYPELEAETVVLQVNLNQDRAFYANAQAPADPDSLTVLVNKHYLLSAGYAPKLEALGSRYGSGSLRPEAAAAFRSMADAARASGISLRSVSAYRSYQTQKNTYNSWLARYSQAAVDTFSARPGSSEHQTGLALDINVASSLAHFENTAAYAWLKTHCAEYGFILRYNQGKEALTGYRFEPWHYRYVGTEIAKVCMEQGICYEEYLALQPEG